MKANAAWHQKHRMPPRATMEQRVAWHREHAKHCACRPIPASVQAYLAGERSNSPKSRAGAKRSS
jgi:hypothetical protein